MPYQNRVDPFGRFHAVEARGAWMGNPGILHNEAREIVAQWRLRRWLICKLSFKERHREIFSPRRYSELFFLDEATAFSAGHRPCAECRRERYKEFCTAWCEANPKFSRGRELSADDVDRQLHVDRALRGGGKQFYDATLDTLPFGTFIDLNGVAHLVGNGRLHAWSFAGYRSATTSRGPGDVVRVLTPRSIVSIFRAGFVPQVHESAPWD